MYYAFFSRENFLVLDIFFEALNYETIEQKKAYDVAGLLGMFSEYFKRFAGCFASVWFI